MPQSIRGGAEVMSRVSGTFPGFFQDFIASSLACEANELIIDRHAAVC